MSLLLNTVLLVFLLITAIAVMRVKVLLAMVMLFGLYSLLVSSLFVVLDAPDVAFTEAAVGTGISTVLMLATLAAIRQGHSAPIKPGKRFLPFLLSLAMGTLVIFGIQDLPNFGEEDSPAYQEVAKHYIEKGQQETGVPNLVTAVLASYRGFDTLGEVTVVLTAGIGVLLLLGRREKVHLRARKAASSEPEQPENPS